MIIGKLTVNYPNIYQLDINVSVNLKLELRHHSYVSVFEHYTSVQVTYYLMYYCDRRKEHYDKTIQSTDISRNENARVTTKNGRTMHIAYFYIFKCRSSEWEETEHDLRIAA